MVEISTFFLLKGCFKKGNIFSHTGCRDVAYEVTCLCGGKSSLCNRTRTGHWPKELTHRHIQSISSSIIIGSSSCSSCSCSCSSSLFSRLSLKSTIGDRFWSSRCLNYHIDVPDKIGSFSSGATASMVVKNGTKKT